MAVALALVSGLLHAAWNALAKRTRWERGATLGILSVALLVTLGLLVLVPDRALPAAALGWTVLAGLGEAAYLTALGRAYARGELGLTYAVSRGSALVFIWPLAYLAQGSMPRPLDLAATALVVGGVALLRPRSDGPPRIALGWSLATGASIAAYHTGYAGAVRAGAAPVPVFAAAIALAMLLLWPASGAEVRREASLVLRSTWGVLAGVLCAFSFVLLVVALSSGGSGPMLGVRNVSVGVAVLLGVALGERPVAREWAGLVVLGLGVATFALAEASR